jgi:hypothetical protein
MDTAKTSLFPLPTSQVVETLYVQLADGTVVPRAPHEVQTLLDSDPKATLIGSATR